jgi:hypothetical protein
MSNMPTLSGPYPIRLLLDTELASALLKALRQVIPFHSTVWEEGDTKVIATESRSRPFSRPYGHVLPEPEIRSLRTCTDLLP